MPQKLSPIETVINYKQEIDDALKSLQSLSDENFTFEPSNITWDDVGYIEHLAELVTRARDYAFQQTIYLHKGSHNETIN